MAASLSLPCADLHAQAALRQLKILAGTRDLIEIAVPAAAAPKAALSPDALWPSHEKNVLPERLGRNPLIVVHAVRDFDDDAAAVLGIDALVAKFKAQKRSVTYLVNDQTPEGYSDWYTQDRWPDFEIFSEGGEHNLPLHDDEVTVVGGFFGSYDGARGCQTLAARDAIRMHFEDSEKPFTVHFPVRAIYFYGEDSATREELLALDAKTASAEKLHELFDDFARLFFLTDNFSEVPAFGHPYPAGPDRRNKNYRGGASVDVDGYSFELFFGGISVSKFGHGPRKVSLRLQNQALIASGI